MFFWSSFCASNTWALTSIFCRQQDLYFNDFMELFWFLVDIQKSENDVLSLAVTIAWALWARRNEKRHGGKFMTGLDLVNWCGRYIDSFKAANSADAISSPSAAPSALVPATHCRQVWSPPTGSFFKVNVDGAVFVQQRKSRAGVVICNCEGLLMGALSMKLNQQLGSLETEAKAYELGILFARDMGFHEVALEGDSVTVSNAIAGISPPPSLIASVVCGISSLLSAFRSFSISHVGRKGNKVAHLLAKHA